MSGPDARQLDILLDSCMLFLCSLSPFISEDVVCQAVFCSVGLSHLAALSESIHKGFDLFQPVLED